ncbi:hypothetical protein O6H91_15G002800 [Diphasiastrum complanatum]|uniref:Uncharacterized protein n=1 Tax=Diphasiastrum complanatum TaxID=34168 RepID=A0ACC2BF88_DIPCM|nr:hypothetical protein O6H91_15G002800 [Diphasiastrum complanatum]
MASEQEKDATSRDTKRQRSARKNGGARRWTAAHDEMQALRDLIESYAPRMRVWAKLSNGLWWPGYVPNMEDLPKSILKHKRVGWTCVHLYGSDNTLMCPEFVWLQAKSLLEYGKNLDELNQQEPSRCEMCRETGVLISCEHCLRLFHSTCMTPSAKRISKGPWACPTCMVRGSRQNDELHRSGFSDTSHEVERIIGCRVQAASHFLLSSLKKKDIEAPKEIILNHEQEKLCLGSNVLCSVQETPVDEEKGSSLETEGSKSEAKDTVSNEACEHDKMLTSVPQAPSKGNASPQTKETVNVVSSKEQTGEDKGMSMKGLTAGKNKTEGDLIAFSLAKDCATDKDILFIGHHNKESKLNILHIKAEPIADTQREFSGIGLSENVRDSENMAPSSKPVIEAGVSSVDTSFRADAAECMQEVHEELIGAVDVQEIPEKLLGAVDALVTDQEGPHSPKKNMLAVIDTDAMVHSNAAEILQETCDSQQICGVGSEGSVFKESSKPSEAQEPTSELEYLVKWSGRAHIHDEWVSESQLRSLAKRKLDNYKAKYGTLPINLLEQKWCEPQRIIARRKDFFKGEEALVKWSGLPYDECTWESLNETVISQNSQLLTAYTKFDEAAQKLEANISTGLVRTDLTLDRSTQVEIETITEQPKELAGGSLFPHQIEALNWLRKCWHRRKNVILADEMGLGKTISASAFISSLYNEFKAKAPCLVLVPLSTMPNWLAELSAWAPDLNVIEYHGSSKARAIIKQFEWYAANEELGGKKRRAFKFNVILTTYEMVIADPGPLRSVPWEALIVDEGHRLKNSGSKLFHLLNTFSFSHRVLLTGTPLQNNLGELYNLLNFLQPDIFPSLTAFQDKFSALSTAEQVDEIRKLVAPHMLRRLKKDAMQEIPPKTERVVPVELTAVQAEYYRALLTRNFQLLRRGAKSGHQQSMLNIIMELRKVCNHPYLIPGTEPEFGTSEFLQEMRIKASGKLTLLHSMLVNLKEQGHRVLIFSQMTKLLDILEDYLTFQFGHNSYERVDGSVPVSERQAAIARFNKDLSRFVFLLSTRACGLGINLATADTVIIYDSDFNPHADIQAMNRAHRIGQSKKLLVYRLVVRASVEERILQLAKKKLMLDHLFASKSGSQKEVEDIIQWGTEELFHESSGQPQEQNIVEHNASSSSGVEPADEIEISKRKRVGGLGDVQNDKCHEVGRPKVMWDDAAVARLLDRSVISVGTDEGVEGENENDMLGSLKAWDWNDQETDEQEAVEPAGTDNKSLLTGEQKSGGEEDNKWEKLLRTRWEKFQREEEEALGRGKRQRKVVSYNESLGKNIQEVSSESEEQLEEPEPEYTPAGQALKQKLAKLRARQKERIAQRQMEFAAAESSWTSKQLSAPVTGAGIYAENQVHPKSLLPSFEDIRKLSGGSKVAEAPPGLKSGPTFASNAPFGLNFGAGKAASTISFSASQIQKGKYEEISFMESRTISEKPPVDQLFGLPHYFKPNSASLLSKSPSNLYGPPEFVDQPSIQKTVAPIILPTSSTILDDLNRTETSIGRSSIYEITSSNNATSSTGNGLRNFFSGLPTNLARMRFASGFYSQGLPVHYDNPSRSFLHVDFSNKSQCNTSYGIQPMTSIDIGPSVHLQTSELEGKPTKSTGDVEPKADHISMPSFPVNLQKEEQPQIHRSAECGTTLKGIATIRALEESNQTERQNGEVDCFRRNETGSQDGSVVNREATPLPLLPSTSSTSGNFENPFNYRKLPPLTMSLGLGGSPICNQGLHMGVSAINPYSGGSIGKTINSQTKSGALPSGFPSKNLNFSSLTKDILSKVPCGDLGLESDASDARAHSSWMQQLPSTLQSGSNFSLGTSSVHIWSLLDSKKSMLHADKTQASETLSWSEEELDALWSGVRRHGRGNWLSMLQDPRLCFSKYRTVKDLSERWKEEQQKLFGGPEFSSAQIANETMSLLNSNTTGRMPIPLFGGAFTDKNDVQGTFGKAEDILGPSKYACLKADADINFLFKESPNKESIGNNTREPLQYSSLPLDRAEFQERVSDLRHISSLTSKAAVQFPLSDKGERVSLLGTSAAYESILCSTSKQLSKFAGANSQTKKGRKMQEVGSVSRNFLSGSSLISFNNVEASYNTMPGEVAAGNGKSYDPFADMWKSSDAKMKLGRKKASLPPWGTSEITNQFKNSLPSYGRILPDFAETSAVQSYPTLPPVLFPDFCLNSKKLSENDIDTKKQSKSFAPLSSPGKWPSFPVDSIMNTSKRKFQVPSCSSFTDINVLASSSNPPSASSVTPKGSSTSNLPHWLKEAFSIAPPPAPALSPQVAAVAQAVAMLHRGQKPLLRPWLHPWHPLVPPKELPKRKKKKRSRKVNGRPAGTELECSEELSGGANLFKKQVHSKVQSCADLSFELRNVKSSREFTLPSVPILPLVQKPLSPLPKIVENTLASGQLEPALSRILPGVNTKDGTGLGTGINFPELSFIPPLHSRLPLQLHKSTFLPDFQSSSDGKFTELRSKIEWGGKLQTMSIASTPPIHIDSRQSNLFGGQSNVGEQSCEQLKMTKSELPQWLLSAASGSVGAEGNCITLTSDRAPVGESSSETHSDPDIRSKCSGDEVCQEVSSDETISDHE